jgi:dTDP-4-dehydrorhamnose reductase
MGKRLVVTGFGGFVAGSIVWQALQSRRWDVHAFSLMEPTAARPRFRCAQFDLRDPQALAHEFDRAAPDAVIHTAALADIDYCENHPAEAHEVNVGVTRELARLCAANGTKLIFCSTDTVFGGEKGMYTEDDPPRPLNRYAHTKVAAEEVVRVTVPNGVVARLSLVMGLPLLGAGNSFLARMIASLDQHIPVVFPANEIRTPVDVITLGAALLELADGPWSGTLHLSGCTRLNRYEMACAIAERLGYPADLVIPSDSNAMPGRAPRPNDVSLDNSRAKGLLKTPAQTFLSGLDLVLGIRAQMDQQKTPASAWDPPR